MIDIHNYYKDAATGQWKAGRDPAAELIRTQRNRLLYESDWTQMPDVTLLNKTAWATYRQELRDITSQPGYPNNVVWPTPPQG